MVHNKEDAEDLTSEFFIKLAHVANKYISGNGHKTWLITIARNLVIDFMRKNKREYATEEIYEEVDLTCMPTSSTESAYLTKQNFKDLIHKLNPKEQEVITLKILGDFTFKEISLILKEPMGTITWRYKNAISKLRRYIDEP